LKRPAAPDEGFARRSRRFLWIGALVGAVAGALVGGIAGVIAFESARALWASILAGAVFVGGVGAFVSTLSSLEPPRPGRELSDRDPDPVTSAGDGDERSGLVVEESPQPEGDPAAEPDDTAVTEDPRGRRS
jgi:hypothetical protein